MLREQRKYNHIKCSITTRESRKIVKDRKRKTNRNKWKTVTNIVDISPTLSVSISNVSNPNIPLKKRRVSE